MRRLKWKTVCAVLFLSAALVAMSWQAYEARSENVVAQAATQNPAPAAFQDTRPEYQDLVPIVGRAIWGDGEASRDAAKQLRTIGPRAAEFLFSRDDLRVHPKFDAVIDEVCLQKDARYSGLYWHRSLDDALSVAQKERKPVLSLRLLGNLTDELSCANSRFFRTTLYPSPAVRETLSKQFILHWESVRPVPIITIDLPEGRQIKQTITGNSLHLVLDWRGRPIDVLPGLYGAGEFHRQLAACQKVAAEFSELSLSDFVQRAPEFHRQRLVEAKRTLTTWEAPSESFLALVNSVDGTPTEAQWAQLAALYQTECTPTGYASVAVTEKGRPAGRPNARVAGKLAISKSIVEIPMFAGLKKLTESIAMDTVKNEFALHRAIHEHMAKHPTLVREELVTYVYASVFLSPLDDPWYGLSQPDVYAALPNNGRVDAVTQNSRR